MSILKCVSCGSTTLKPIENNLVECEYCKTKSELAKYDTEIQRLHANASNLRMNFIFDRAIEEYNHIIRKYIDNHEAYWGLVICRYGIEFVKDYDTKDVITSRVNLDELELVTQSFDFKQAYNYAPASIKEDYYKIAKKIEQIQQDIANLKNRGDKYDVFISYKETDEQGNKTNDFNIATNIYNKLTSLGYKVFFSSVTLKDVPGSKFEPIIHRAINTTDAFLLVSSSSKNAKSNWVTNEWSRYLNLINKKEKKSNSFLPIFDNSDLENYPPEITNFQGVDINDLGALKNIAKFVESNVSNISKTSSSNNKASEINKSYSELFKMMQLELINKNYDKVYEIADSILFEKQDVKEVYYYLLLANYEVTKLNELVERNISFWENKNFKKYYMFLNSDEQTNFQTKISVLKSAASNADTHYIDGYNLLKNAGNETDFELAFKHLLTAANNGSHKATYQIGLCYFSGEGIEENDKEGLAWLKKAGLNGNAEACNKLGDLYFSGKFVKQSYIEGAKWYKKSANFGDAVGLLNIGKCHINNHGVKKDYHKAMEYLLASASMSNSEAQRLIGEMYEEGMGVEKDSKKATEWYEKARSNGNKEADGDLALQYFLGDGVKRDVKKAYRLFGSTDIEDEEELF